MSEEIPEVWKKVKFTDIAEIISGGTPSKKIKEYWDGDIDWLTVNDFNNDLKFVREAKEKITQLGLKNSSTKILKKGQVIISARGTVGVVAMLNKDMAFNQSNYGINAKEGLSTNNFLYYLLKYKINELRRASYGAVFDTITKSTFENLEIFIPEDIKEQKAIASVLSSLDDKIDLLYRQNKTLEQMAETLFRKWFIEDAKEDWEKVKLGDIAEIKIGRTPPRKEFHWFSKNKNENNTKWVSVKDLGENGVFIFNTAEYLTNEAIEKFKIPIIPANTVLLSFKMTIGRIGITTEEMVSNEAIAHFILKQDTIISNEYLYLFLKAFKFQELGSTSTIVTSINSKMIKDINIIIPEKNLMLKFHKITRPIFNKIKFNQQQILTLEKLRDTLLPNLMSGKVRVEV